MIGFGTSCSKDDTGDELIGGCGDFQTDFQAYLNAAKEYGQDPTVENCEAAKAAAIAFVEEYRDCAFFTEGDYEEALNEIRNSSCSE